MNHQIEHKEQHHVDRRGVCFTGLANFIGERIPAQTPSRSRRFVHSQWSPYLQGIGMRRVLIILVSLFVLPFLIACSYARVTDLSTDTVHYADWRYHDNPIDGTCTFVDLDSGEKITLDYYETIPITKGGLPPRLR